MVLRSALFAVVVVAVVVLVMNQWLATQKIKELNEARRLLIAEISVIEANAAALRDDKPKLIDTNYRYKVN